MKGPRAVRASALLLLLIAAALEAQPRPAPAPKPYHPQRFLVIGNAVFLESWKPVTTLGGLWQLSLRPTRVGRDSLGVLRITPPRVYLHTALTAGASFNPLSREDKVSATAYGQLGLVRRTDTFVTAWGIAAQGIAQPAAAGVALRAELLDNLGLQVGYVGVRNERGGRLLVSIDYFKKICEDLGFGWLC